MKKLILSALVLGSLSLQAQKLDNSLLWKISGKDLAKPSYLFGTIHMTCDASLKESVKKAMDATSQLYLELDMDDPSMQTKMMSGIMMKNGSTLSSLCSAEDFKIVDEFLTKNIGYSAKLLNTVKPFFISAMLYPKMINCPMQSIENELMKLSKEQNEEIFGLESPEDQMLVFDAIPYKDQMNELIKTAKNNLENDKKEIQKLLEVYKTEDLNAMIELSRKSDNVISSKYEDDLLTKRNKNWISKITEVSKAKPTFFGVGAAHLGGENGVIMLLRKAGYKVEAVK
ncbi:TraB/GumN family protein [Flavobacterium sp. SM15]|uniref:TraB/GumN family protein n=1 Tax=Flavobacterium sp. SM15 TaxID=2908005 RepID=UPI001EDB483F|nr:TraB/GumN family protein [Flavobacterium sp. SM15]MCG2612550.1 TraB/GumN family protein [Flavobacterium sp. SM15]